MPGQPFQLPPVPAWADPAKATPEDSLIQKMLRGGASMLGMDDPNSQLMGVAGPMMALDPLQKQLLKQTLESMSLGQLPVPRAKALIEGLKATPQDIGNAIAGMNEGLRGGVRRILNWGHNRDATGRLLPQKAIPFAESTASPVKPLVGKHNQGPIRTMRNTKELPTTVDQWSKVVYENPGLVRRLGQDPEKIQAIREFLAPMKGSSKYEKYAEMGLEDFIPIYEELRKKVGW